MSAFMDKVRGNWNQVQGKLKEKYGETFDNEEVEVEGEEEQFLGKLQEKTGESKQELKNYIDNI